MRRWIVGLVLLVAILVMGLLTYADHHDPAPAKFSTTVQDVNGM